MRVLGQSLSAFKNNTRIAKGSILVFAVVLLALLALISSTILFTVRQGVKVSQNAAQSVEANLAADAGLTHAQKVLRDTITTHTIFTPEGVFGHNPSNTEHPWLIPHDYAADRNPPYVSPLRFFSDSTTPTEPALSVRLSTDPNSLEVGFTSSLLYASSRDTDSAGVPLEYARRNDVIGQTSTFYKEGDNFNASVFKARTLPRLSGIRGAYFVWVSDLDAKLYAKSNDLSQNYDGWGLNFENTLPLATYASIHSCDPNSQSVKDTILSSILHFEFNDGTIDYSFGDAAILDDVFTLNTGSNNPDPRFPHYHSTREMTTQLLSLYQDVETTPVTIAPKYEELRADLDFYFTVYKDISDNNLQTPQKFIKDNSISINVNSAPVEVIAAAISQVPGESDPLDPDNHNPIGATRAFGIAKRIVAKRPFLCRMDFEDFLAAQIRGAYDSTSVPPVFLGYPQQPIDLDQPLESVFATTTSIPYVRMLYYALQRRWGPGYQASVLNNIAASDDNSRFGTTPELTLSQYLEIPGITALNSAHLAADIGGTKYWPNEPRYQMLRFRFFFNDDEGTDIANALRASALISPREFNNIINSVTSIFDNDDDQDAVPNEVLPNTNSIVVSAGDDYLLQTTPQGDDIVGPPVELIVPGSDGILDSTVLSTSDDQIIAGTNIIWSGPDGVIQSVVNPSDTLVKRPITILAGPNLRADTWISANRPSYYSFIDDVHFTELFWQNIENAISSAPAPANPDGYDKTHILAPELSTVNVVVPGVGTMPIRDADTRAARIMRFYYRLPLAGGTKSPASAPHADEATLDNLVSWRCMPNGMTNVSPDDDSNKRSGFYQLSFDAWADGINSSYSVGFMQCLGDVSYMYSDGVLDPSEDDFLYSAAKPWSGRVPSTRVYDTDRSGLNPPDVGLGNGDVSWGPQFAFRSRYFAVYVLGQGVASPEKAGITVTYENLKSQGEKRIEAVYDALLDQIIWQRSPITDKRALGEPVP